MSNIHRLDPNDLHAIAQEVACEMDRAYFRMHPGATSYTRDHIPHEYPDFVYEDGEVVSVHVHLLGPGMRARLPLQRMRVVCEGKKKGKRKSKKGLTA